MAENLKVFGQVAPSANTDTTLYTVPAGAQAAISSINICNRGATAATFRIAVRPDGAALANQHYQCYDMTVDANAIFVWQTGITMADNDVLTVRASNGNLSFSAFGSEITP